jgi:hypothetical protein
LWLLWGAAGRGTGACFEIAVPLTSAFLHVLLLRLWRLLLCFVRVDLVPCLRLCHLGLTVHLQLLLLLHRRHFRCPRLRRRLNVRWWLLRLLCLSHLWWRWLCLRLFLGQLLRLLCLWLCLRQLLPRLFFRRCLRRLLPLLFFRLRRLLPLLFFRLRRLLPLLFFRLCLPRLLPLLFFRLCLRRLLPCLRLH